MRGHFGAGKVVFRVAEQGTGIIAGGPIRAAFEALGVHDVVASRSARPTPTTWSRRRSRVDQQQLAPLGRGPRLQVSDILGRRSEGAEATE